MAIPGSGPGKGLLASLQRLGGTLLAIGHTRLALLATEMEEEKQRLIQMLAWGAVMLLLGSMTCLFLALTITVVFWDTHRLQALTVVTLLFALGAVWAGWQVRKRSQLAPGGMLAASLAELEADMAALTEAAARSHAESSGEPLNPEDALHRHSASAAMPAGRV